MIERLLVAEKLLAEGSVEAVEAAERLYRSVAEADPRSAIAVVGLARVAHVRGDDATARMLAERALVIDPEEDAARRLVEALAAAASRQPASTPPPRRGWLSRLLDRLLGRPRPVS